MDRKLALQRKKLIGKGVIYAGDAGACPVGPSPLRIIVQQTDERACFELKVVLNPRKVRGSFLVS